MGYYRIALIALLLMLSSSVFAYETSKQLIEFPLSTANRSVTLSFYGAVFNDKSSPAISESSENEINQFVYRIIKENKNKNAEAILNLWNPDERNEIKKLIIDTSNLDRNAAFFRNILSSKLMGYIEYGDFIICYVKHEVKGLSSSYLKSYPLMLSGKNLFQTNSLSRDFLFAKLSYDLGVFFWPNKNNRTASSPSKAGDR